MLYGIIARIDGLIDGLIGGLWRQVRRAGMEQRTVLAVTHNERLINDLRVLAIQNAWNIRFASNLGQAVARQPQAGICVVVYDRDGGTLDAVRLFARSRNPVLTIVLSNRPDPSLRAAVVRSGGFDVASSDGLTSAINAALAIAAEIDACEAALLV